MKTISCAYALERNIARWLMAGILAGGALLSHGQSTMMPEEAATPESAKIKAAIDATHVVTFGDQTVAKDSISKLLNMFYVDQFRHFQDPRAPYFMFLSKDSKLAMGIGGLIRMRGYYDWNGSIPVNGFSPYYIPIPKDPTSMKRLFATPAGTGLFFTVLGNNNILGSFIAFIQGDFSGYDNRDFKLKKAYLTAGDWTVGYTKSTFEDTQAEPATIDGSGPNGGNSRSNVLLRYMHTFKNKWTIAGSLEYPTSSIGSDDVYTKKCSDYVPDVAAFVQYQWNGGASHVRLSGLCRVMTYRDLVVSNNYSIVGWGGQFSTVIKAMPALNFYGTLTVGQGHESYTTDLANDNFDLIGDPHRKGRMYAPTALGCVLGAQYYITPKIFTDIALSQQRFYPKENPGDGQYKYGLYGAINLFWDITPRFEVGAEYLAGKRMNFNGTHGDANRITAMMMLSF